MNKFSQFLPAGERNPQRRDRGIVLVMAMMMVVAVMALAMVAVQSSDISSDEVRRDYQEERVFYVSDGGASYAESWLRDLISVQPNPSQEELDLLEVPSVSGFTFRELTVTKLPFENDVRIVRGPLAGLVRDVQPYLIRSRAALANLAITKQVDVRVDQVYTGLYQYAMYWDRDLELWPLESNPSVYEGHIHSNGDIYLGAGRANFDIIGSVTAAGHIYNTPKDPFIESNGSVRIADLDGQFHALSYDWRDSNWVVNSMEDWDGLVMDSSHGVQAAPYPIQTLPDPIQIIKPGDPFLDDSLERQLRFRYRAGLKVLDGFATDSLGNTVSLPLNIIVNHSVYDWREGHDMEMRTLDLGALIDSGYAPSNGVIYLSYSHANAAVRITNGSRLPLGGLVIATDNPCYVWGNYNTVDKQPSSIFCDAFNVYSVAWTDARDDANLNNRNGDNTWVYTCVVAGNDTTVIGDYGGGASSLIRLHERWSANDQLTYRGSLVCLWVSEQATGPFVNASFWEHHRNSGFDPDLLDPEFWPEYSFWNSQVMRSSWRSF